MQTLLKTKLFKPQYSDRFVSRQRLVDLLEQGIHCKLTLISAPAGYGKTTLLSDWISKSELPTCWVSLDSQDNDLRRFLAYIIASLQTIDIGVDEQILNSYTIQQANQLTAYLIALINQIAASDRRFSLVLDDYHRIASPEVHEVLVYILDHLPPKMNFVIAARADPPLKLAQLRAQGALCEIRAADLRFTTEEAVNFLSRRMSLELTPKDVTTLTQKTEGWAVGLQLAGISLSKHPDSHTFITAFAGNDRYIADYLADEALSRQPAHIQSFLLQTSILDRLSAPLCDAVTGRAGSQSILATLENSNLFILPLDSQRKWYRYHHLFQDLLLQRLRQNCQPGALPALHSQASRWYSDRGMIIEAIQHAFEADDMRRIVRLIEANIFTMLDQGAIRLLLGWLDSIPENLKPGRPWLCVAQAFVLIYAGELEAGESALQLAEGALSNLETIEALRMEGYIRAIRAYSCWMKGMGEQARDLVTRALALIPEEEHSLRAFANMVLGGAQIQCYNFEEAAQALRLSIDQARSYGNDHIHILASSHLVYLKHLQAEFKQAEQICRQIISYYEGGKVRTSPAIAQIFTLMADVFAKRHELDLALALAKKGLDISKQWNQIDTMTVSYIHLTEILISRGEFNRAAEVLEEIKALSLQVSPWFKDIIEETGAKIDLASGNIPAAVRWAGEASLDHGDEITPTRRNTYHTYARVLFAEGKISEASQLLERLIEQAEDTGSKGYLLGLFPLKSLVLSELGDQEEALKVLVRALELAEPEGYLRGFVQLGDRLVPLLRQAFEAKIKPAFVVEILEAIAGKETIRQGIGAPTIDGKPGDGDGMLEPLSQREIEVLEWMAKGCTNQEIAGELILSLHTIKSHARNIYGKLGVKNRTEAVARARLLGLLPQD
jgi:LuxR family maltose regulon positive regulatory protein